MIVQEAAARKTRIPRESQAYQSGWQDGRFGQPGTFAANASLTAWHDLDRLAYYRGHREGRRVRGMLLGSKSA